jgi:hypothetical protein
VQATPGDIPLASSWTVEVNQLVAGVDWNYRVWCIVV